MRQWIIRLVCLAAILGAVPATAQNLFAPVAKVNDGVITAYERDQRARMLELFQVQGDLRNEAVVRLIEERLQLQEAERLGLSVTEAEIVAGETEFAARANLGREEFLAALQQFGVARESMRDFVTAGLLWRKVLRARFGPPNTAVGNEDIDREISLARPEGGPRLLVSEIVLRGDSPEWREISLVRAGEIREIENEFDFAAAAVQFSIGSSRLRGGQLEWLDADSLPPEVRRAVLGLEAGEISAPIRTDESILLFLLRERRDVADTTPAGETLDYATLLLAGGRSPETLELAAQIDQRAATCDDLYGLARNEPAEYLVRLTQPVGQVPADIRAELQTMDAGEVSTNLTRNNGQTLVFLMLCDRLANKDSDVLRTNVAEALLNQRATGKGRVLLADLRANAVIELY